VSTDENMDLGWYKTEVVDPFFRRWLENVPFPRRYFEPAAFPAHQSLYRVESKASSLLEAVVHRGIPSAGFSESDLSSAVSAACDELGEAHDAWWFHVNVHDGVARVVERFGHYNWAQPLLPIYILLNHHTAKEGGTTYAGLVSPQRKWMLLFEDGMSISIHGTQQFVNAVSRRLPGARIGAFEHLDER
jgi:hypothetical protein